MNIIPFPTREEALKRAREFTTDYKPRLSKARSGGYFVQGSAIVCESGKIERLLYGQEGYILRSAARKQKLLKPRKVLV